MLQYSCMLALLSGKCAAKCGSLSSALRAQTYARWEKHAGDALRVYDDLIAQAPDGGRALPCQYMKGV